MTYGAGRWPVKKEYLDVVNKLRDSHATTGDVVILNGKARKIIEFDEDTGSLTVMKILTPATKSIRRGSGSTFMPHEYCPIFGGLIIYARNHHASPHTNKN